MIEVPPKVWTPKIINQYRVPEYEDVDDSVFDFKPYGCLISLYFTIQVRLKLFLNYDIIFKLLYFSLVTYIL